MPANAFTPWWRLLIDNINTKQHIALRITKSDIDPTCVHCHLVPEDAFHYIVGCPIKWFY
jgi:hypothetical protein